MQPTFDSRRDSDPITGLERVRHAVTKACVRAHRDPRSVTLIAASKAVSANRIDRAIAADHGVFGENRVQEAQAKWPSLRQRHPDLALHLIGPLQTNKVPQALALFDAIHSVDRPALCEVLARFSREQGRQPTLFVQINTGAEKQKSGVLPEQADRFVTRCRERHGLAIAGLMCVPPLAEPPDRHFAMLADIARRNGVSFLSMGMTADFVSAIEHGATHIRVGSGIFGSRP